MAVAKTSNGSYRNPNGEWMPAPFGKNRIVDEAPLRIDIKFPVLGFLMDAEMTGYDLKRQFQESVGFFYRVSDGSLYPALKKLAKDGLVTMRSESRGKRARKLYAITARGRERFLKMLAEPSPPVFVHDEAQVKIYFGHHSPKSALAHMRRMRQFDEMWARELSSLVAEVKARGENPFRTVLLEIGQQLTAFKARMMAKLELGMAREVSLASRAKTTSRSIGSENYKRSSVQ